MPKNDTVTMGRLLEKMRGFKAQERKIPPNAINYEK